MADLIPIRLHFHDHRSCVRMARDLPRRERWTARVLSPMFVCVTLEAGGVVYDWIDNELLVYCVEHLGRFRPGTPHVATVYREALVEPAWWTKDYRLFIRNCSQFCATMLGYPRLAGMTPDLLWCILWAKEAVPDDRFPSSTNDVRPTHGDDGRDGRRADARRGARSSSVLASPGRAEVSPSAEAKISRL